MSVSIHETAEARKIDVLGRLDSAANLAALEEGLRAVGGRPCELSFYDVHTLPGELLELLAELLDRRREIKIYAYHSYLVHALLRLGLPAVYVPSRSLTRELGGLSALALAGSAESLDKILYLVERLPPGEVAVFVAQHILEEGENHLDRLLKVRTGYEVIMPRHLMPVRPGTIYVAPPGHHMKVGHGLVYLTRDRKVRYARPSIDVLFESLAEEYGAEVLAVLLCGFGEDGVRGLATLREKNGWALLEESEECGEARVLTDRARERGEYDYLLGVKSMACFLATAVAGRGREPDSQVLDLFLEAVDARYGYDFRGYQRGTVLRRIDKLMRLLKLESFFDFQREVFGDPGVFERLFVELSVNVSELFRHPAQFRVLRERILPYLDSFPHLKIWSAGCATGEEAYSLAILLDELGMLEKTRIFATDINGHVLEQARSGLFPLQALEQSRGNYLQSGGAGGLDAWLENRGRFLRVPQRLRERILFHHHSLAHDGVFNEFQLILCRNVLIYFDSSLQQRVMERFSRSLHRDGFLMLGPNEGLETGEGGRFFADYGHGRCIYRWKQERP